MYNQELLPQPTKFNTLQEIKSELEKGGAFIDVEENAIYTHESIESKIKDLEEKMSCSDIQEKLYENTLHQLAYIDYKYIHIIEQEEILIIDNDYCIITIKKIDDELLIYQYYLTA